MIRKLTTVSGVKEGRLAPIHISQKALFAPTVLQKPNSSHRSLILTPGLGLPPHSTQDLSSVCHADSLFLFGASKMFILFLSLALSFCSLSTLYPSLSWIWNRGDTSKFEQTVLTWLESISADSLTLTTKVFCCTCDCWLFTLPGNQHSSNSSQSRSLFLDPLLFTFSPPLFPCSIFFLQDLINPLLLASSYIC